MLFTFATSAFSAGPDTASSPLLSLVRKQYNPNASVEAKVTLTIYWSVREKEEKKQGRLILAPGDRFHVTLGSETFVSNGSIVWDYNSAADQVVINRFADIDLSNSPSRLFAKYLLSCPFRELGRANGSAELSWKSDSSQAPYPSIRVWVQVATGTITKCEMTDRNGNLFTYTFTGTVFGKNASKETFDFVIPKSARVVDSRKQ